MVLVCNDPKFIFLKTRKTAGTSVEMLLEQFCVPEGTEITEQRPVSVGSKGIVGARLTPLPFWRRSLPFAKKWLNHMPAWKVHQYVGDQRWNESVKVATVRDPYDRMVSQFHWRNRQTDFNSWSDEDVREKFLAYLQSDWPDDRDVVMIGGKCIIDHFIRFEQRDADIAALGKKLGVTIDLGAMPHTKNMTKARRNRGVEDYYTPEAKALVEKRLSWLFDDAGYATRMNG